LKTFLTGATAPWLSEAPWFACLIAAFYGYWCTLMLEKETADQRARSSTKGFVL